MTDDDLRSRLRRADPAAGLAPLAPDSVSRLLENTMTAATVAPRPAVRFRTLAAAALVLVAVVGGWFLMRPQDNPSGPSTVVAAPSPSTAVATRSPSNAVATPSPSNAVATPSPSTGAVVKITAPGVAAKCVEPSADRLSTAADFAFAGSVTAVNRGLVTLKVTKVYRGAAAGEVQVEQTGYVSETLLGSGKFETGKDYLVASSEGSMLICGYSGEAASPGLRELYDAAF